MLVSASLNMAEVALDRHVAAGLGDVVAARWLAADGTVTAATYAELAARTNRFAHVLADLGVARGDVVATLLGPGAAWTTVALGTLRHGAVLAPLFSAFGPEPIRQRLERSDARVLVTTAALYDRKVAAWCHELPGLHHVLVVGGAHDGHAPDARTVDLDERLVTASEATTRADTTADDIALLHFTSGTTGAPKAAMHGHGAVVGHEVTARQALELRAGDVLWCTADPGWVTGTSYGLLAPLAVGATLVADAGRFDAERWYRTVEEQRVTVWYTSPTALRMLMAAGDGAARAHDLSSLRVAASVGEPLDAAVAIWARGALGVAVRDTWWQTETGAIMLAGGADDPPGAMGRPLPGVDAMVLQRGDDGRAARDRQGRVFPATRADEPGELALRQGWPSMFHGYHNDLARTTACFADGWYLSGDVVRRDEAGVFWFVGRADDQIKTAGHLVGPYEVERVLLAHPAVREAGVFGVPDEVAGAVVAAVVAPRPGVPATDGLALDIIAFARRRLGAALAPRAVRFTETLPRNHSGKILRRVLRARWLGDPDEPEDAA